MVQPGARVARVFGTKDLHMSERKASIPASPTRTAPPRPPSLLVDGIHDRLDGVRPNGTAKSSLQELRNMIKTVLTSGHASADDRFQIHVAGITARQDGLFNIRLGNACEVTRTLEETELHILLENQTNLVGVRARNNGNSIDGALSKGARPPVPAKPVPKKRSAPDAASTRTASLTGPTQQLSKRINAVDGPVHARPSLAPLVPVKAEKRPSGAAQSKASAGLVRDVHGGEMVALDFTDTLGNQSRIFSARDVNMETVYEHMNKRSHLEKSISGAGCNCWWRAGMLSALLYRDPVALENTILYKLGQHFRKDAAAFRRMGESVRSGGLSTILTNMEAGPPDNGLAQPSRFKMAGTADRDNDMLGEKVCQRIVDGLLERSEVRDDERFNIVYGNRMGDLHHVASLLSQLECDTVVFSRPRAESRRGQAARFDPTMSTIEIYAQPGSHLNRLTRGGSRSQCTDDLLNRLAGVPVLVHRALHYDLSIPRSVLRPETLS
jgi:hypothetical protein